MSLASIKKAFAAFSAYAGVVMSRNVLLLFVMLVLAEVSAVGVIYTTYKNRELFAELEKLRDDAEEMQVVWHQLLLEQSTLASYNRVGEIAQKNLGMKIPDPNTVIVLRQP